MSSRRANRLSRPIDPEFWTLVNELTDPLPQAASVNEHAVATSAKEKTYRG